MLDKYFEVIDREPSTVATYIGYADKHIRPLIGAVKVGALDGDVFDSFYAELRRCRAHCDRTPRVDHRTTASTLRPPLPCPRLPPAGAVDRPPDPLHPQRRP